MPQLATVARALLLISESTGVVPFCQCLMLCLVTGRREVGAGTHWAAAFRGGCCCRQQEHCQQRSELEALRGAAALLAQVEGGGIALATQEGLFQHHLQETMKVFQLLIPYGSHRELDSAVEEKEFESKTVGYLNLAVCKKQANSQFSKLCNLAVFLFSARTGALPQDPANRGGASLACLVPCNCQHSIVPGAMVSKTDTNTRWEKSAKLHSNLQI